MSQLRILVADDNQFMRTAYKRILETQDDFEVVGMASDGQEALDMAVELAPDVAILDVMMPKMNGIEVARQITGHHPRKVQVPPFRPVRVQRLGPSTLPVSPS